MLLKPVCCYVTGVITTALAVSAGSGHWGIGCFFAGILSTLVSLGWYLADAQRAHRAFKFILRVIGPSQIHLAVPAKRETKRERMSREMDTWARLNEPRITARKQEQVQRIAALKPGHPNYDFLNDPELCG